MSDTPRTNERAVGWHEATAMINTDCVEGDFARQLERELAAMTKRADEMERLKEHNAQLFYRIERELADLKAQHAWRPIDTAPKDGTPFLAYDKTNEHPIMVHAYNRGFVVLGDEFNYISDPTHWQPLPEPPKGSDE